MIEHGQVMGNPYGESYRPCGACGMYVWIGGGSGCPHYRPAALVEKRRKAAKEKAAGTVQQRRKPTDPMSATLDAHRERLLNRLGINPE